MGKAFPAGETHAVGAADAFRGSDSRPDAFDSLEGLRAMEHSPSPAATRSFLMSEYEKIYSFQNLYRAYKLSARSKRHKKDVISFELNLSENLWRLHDALESKTYRPAPYYHFTIHDPKTREIQALRFADRVVQRSLCDNVLRPWFDVRLIYDCAACRKGKGTHFAMNRLTEFMRSYYRQHGGRGWILKCDVRKYFDSVDHVALKARLRRYPDPDVQEMLYRIVDSYNPDTGKGLPMGNQSSQWFALYYLDGIDRIIKEKYLIKYYTRYMDDLVLLHPDKETLERCRAEIREVAGWELKLEFNQKTQIIPISQGVDYVGWHFYLTDTGKVIRRLRTGNKRRFKRRLKLFQRQYAARKTDLDAIKRSLASYRGHLMHGHTWKLSKKLFGKFVLVRPSMEGAAHLKMKEPMENT